MNKLKRLLSEKYCIILLISYSLVVVVFGLVYRDNIYLSLNDNLDSNIPIYKMIRDNHLLWKFDEAIPFLGGVIQRSQYKVETSLISWIYILLPPLLAYYIIYIIKIVFSSLGFYYLVKKINEYEGFNFNKNTWGLCGLLYGILGTWPMAALGFASLPWLTLFIYIIYKTEEKKYIPILLFFSFSTSTILIGIFAIFYYFVFIIFISFKKKKVNIPLVLGFVLLTTFSLLLNGDYIKQSVSGSENTIKTLKTVVYNDSFSYCLSRFRTVFLFGKQYYHSGGATLKYIVIPICSVFLLINIYKSIKSKKIGKKEFLYYIVYSCIVFNVLFCCFDNYHLFRRIIPFANGFSFSRFSWLNPFLWTFLFAMVCDNIKCNYKNTLILLAILLVIVDPRYSQLNSMYNDLYWNSFINYHIARDSNHEWTWREYYSEKLFSEVKKSINYAGEWSIAYGLEPGVLQYNGIKTLDGYFPNYPLWYHDKFEKMIQPELDIDKKHAAYWDSSSGMRAYIWSPQWDFILNKKTKLKESYLHININIFKELNGKYIFSRVRITNWNEIGLLPVGRYSMKGSPYKIYVYMLQK